MLSFKKTVSIVLTFVLVISLAVPSLTVGATETIVTKNLTTYLYSIDQQTEMECLFTSALPEIPYIDAADYLNQIYNDGFTETNNGDGTYTVSCPDASMVIDPATDTVHFDLFEAFDKLQIHNEGTQQDSPYVKELASQSEVEQKSVTLDYAAYGIDLIAKDDRIYFPLTTITDLFFITYNAAIYVNGNLYFVHVMEEASGSSYFDNASIYEVTERSASAAEYAYNELCFVIDHFYGRPSKASIAPLIEEMGLDRALDEKGEYGRLLKSFLKSEDVVKYILGVGGLNTFFEDGGHTNFAVPFAFMMAKYPSCSIMMRLAAEMTDPDIASFVAILSQKNKSTKITFDTLKALRDEKYADYELVKSWDGENNNKIRLIKSGDTCVFIFDSFENNAAYAFKWAVDYTVENGIKNFIVDVSCNGGGNSAVLWYMMTLMTNAENHTNEIAYRTLNTLSGNTNVNPVKVDLNLDGVYDELDKDVVYDLNFAVECSTLSFSCGNLLPLMANDAGIPVLGETSGGGACAVAPFYTPCSMVYSISSPHKFVSGDGKDADLGAEVDYVLTEKKTVTGDDGTETETTDYSKMYDVLKNGRLVAEFYAKKNPILGDANLDGEVDITDATTVQRYDVKMVELSDEAKQLADVDRDGEVCIIDATWLQRWDLKMKAPEGIGKPII